MEECKHCGLNVDNGTNICDKCKEYWKGELDKCKGGLHYFYTNYFKINNNDPSFNDVNEAFFSVMENASKAGKHLFYVRRKPKYE
jgi:stress response protein SCP2